THPEIPFTDRCRAQTLLRSDEGVAHLGALLRLAGRFFREIARPPGAALFPYTTLFRSRGAPRRSTGSRGGGSARAARRSASPHRDRKSTRLNSSHVSSSYADFCLKKKRIFIRVTPNPCLAELFVVSNAAPDVPQTNDCS